jgi:putative ABC transport system permease protein
MSIYDLVHETLLSVTSNKVRSFLTVLGIVVGIASVILMVSIGQGSQASITDSIKSAGSNLLMVTPGGRSSGAFGRPGGEGGGGNAGAKLTQDDVDLIKQLPGVAQVAANGSSREALSTPGANVNMSVTGVGEGYQTVKAIETSVGVFISPEDIRGGTKVVVLGPTAVTDLFPEGTDPLGQKVRIKGINFTVVGVTRSKGGNAMFNSDEVAYIPLTALQRYLTGSDGIQTINVEATTAEGMTQLQTDITATLLAAHHITDSTKADFSVMSQSDILSTASTITGTFTLLLAAISGISLVVGGIGIMNMMLTTVTERTREIGLRKAIGARPLDITLQFLAEAITLCLVGGVFGIAIGWGVSEIVTATGVLTTVVSLQSIAVAFGVCATIGIVFGYYPARRAAKLDPIEALRYQ